MKIHLKLNKSYDSMK